MKFCQLGCARHNEPRRQNGQSRAFSRRVSAANCPEGKRGPSGALGAAHSDPQGGWEASRATGRELCDTGHPVLEDSPEGATAGRSPRRIATCAAFGVAVPRAFFGTFFRAERKYCPPRGGRPTVRAGVGASGPAKGELPTAKLLPNAASRGLSARLPAPLRVACRNKDPHKAANPALRRGRPIPYWGR